MRFCNLIHGWVLDRITQNKEHEKAEADVAQWEFSMSEPLPWQSERKPKASTLQEERDLFLALDQMPDH